ncbi:MAG TPA: phosphatase PAP2 family protein [Gemmatimonadaceae bacterium]|nr:phosphatase PAP2 family protein [Gemmatimonadaceae bacterium]
MSSFAGRSPRAVRALPSLTLVLALAAPALASAQEIRQAGSAVGEPVALSDSSVNARGAAEPARPDLRVRPPAIFKKRDLAMVGSFSAGALALMPLDRSIARWSRDPQRQGHDALRTAMEGIETGFELGPLVAGAGLWATGLATRNRTVADMGFHTLAVLGVNQQVTHLLKGAFGRSRPYVTGDSTSTDWRWGSGFREGTDRRSFPSGHTSQAFAFATVMSHEISRTWPRAGKVVTPILYAGAAGAGYARVYHDKHWASDVALGAAVGMLSANATLRFLHGRPNNWLDRVALNTRIVPDGRGGTTVAVSLPTK